MTVQIAVRIPDELNRELEALVERGRSANRTEAIREAITAFVAAERRRAVDEAIIEGYRRVPPTDDELRWADRAGQEMIAEEPW